MATPLKYMYNPGYFEKLCPILERNIPGFDCRDFIFRIFNNYWPDLELKQRVRRITTVLNFFLPKDFPTAARTLVNLSRDINNVVGSQGFEVIFLPDYVEVYGLHHPDESLEALGEITKLVSAEFAVRPFITRYPEKALNYLHKWSRSEDANVRRLSSEGCRPRLPWAAALVEFKYDPSPILPVLATLREDPSPYVRKSVANNINDIAKDHPEIIINLLQDWKGKNPHTDWILRHGCRSLLKKGDARALTLHGFDPENKAGARGLSLPERIKVGDQLDFSFAFINQEKKPAFFRLEYAIDYVTSGKRMSRKIFSLSEKLFPPGKPVTIRRKQSFRDFSTRKHFQGKHQLTVLANGKKIAASEFMVC